MQGLADNLGCQVASLPTKYPGMPLGAKNKELEVWSEVLARRERKLTRWKSQYLFLGGRLTLIKSDLDALPTYILSLFPLPKSIGKKLNKLRRVFLWQGNKEKQGYNLVEWKEVTMSETQGVLAFTTWVPRTLVCCKNGCGDSVVKIWHYGGGSLLRNTAYRATGQPKRWMALYCVEKYPENVDYFQCKGEL